EKYGDADFTIAYAQAIDAARRDDAGAFRDAVAHLRTLQKESAGHEDHSHMTYPLDAQRKAIVLQQVEALQLAAAGRHEEAVAILRKAASAEQSLPFEFGPP